MPGKTYDLEAGLKFKFFPGGSENGFYVFTGFGILIYHLETLFFHPA